MNWREEANTTLRDLLINCHRIGLVTDMDGTISPIVSRPEDAQVTQRNRTILEQLNEVLALVAVVSGRPVDDLQSRVGLSDLVYVGSHGLERWVNGAVSIVPDALQYRPGIERLAEEVRPLAKRFVGLTIEDKGLSLAVHYRNTRDPDTVSRTLEPTMQALGRNHGLSLMQGRKVFEFRVPLKVNKGAILGQLVAEYSLDGVIYLGDDTTDLDAMRKLRSLRAETALRGLSIGVESSEMPPGLRETADLLATDVSDIEELLSWFYENLQDVR